MRSLQVPYRILYSLTGMDPLRAVAAARGLGRFVRGLSEYRSRAAEPFAVRLRNLYPVFTDFGESAGTASGHYFHQDLWAARLIYKRRPHRHVDVGSRIDGFVAHLLVFMEVDVVDVRPLPAAVRGLRFLQGDGGKLECFADSSVDSISSLHAVEHFGLGRYGDPIDPDACFSAMRALARVLRPGGRLYFSVPIGAERVEFNAHRVFAPATVLDGFSSLRLASFAAVDDDGRMRSECKPEDFSGANYACGLFEFTK